MEHSIRFRLEAGETLISLDDRRFHGRTAFADLPHAIPAIEAQEGDARPLRRTMERIRVRLA